MSPFAKALNEVPAIDISTAGPFPLRTVYAWRKGERTPSAWTQTHVLSYLPAIKAKLAKQAKAASKKA